MTAFSTIRLDIAEDVATLTLNSPARLNALSRRMLEEIAAALERLPQSGARALLLTGAGRAFSSGADLQGENGQAVLPDDAGKVLETHYFPVLERLAALRMPVVSAVNGAAAGAGCALALAADFVMAARSAYFLLAFVNIGLVPDAGVTWLLPRLIGRARALEMMMLGERVPAEKAEAWGMIYKTVADAALSEDALALARRLAAGPTVALGLMRAGLAASYEGDLRGTLWAERKHQRLAGLSPDFREGVTAFLERRPARFCGK